jgi:pimeloyl-ACP methyl ester carboxylesterase
VLGASYGTDLALTYMRQHPAGVLSVTLDSVVPPERATLGLNWTSAGLGTDVLFDACRDQVGRADGEAVDLPAGQRRLGVGAAALAHHDHVVLLREAGLDQQARGRQRRPARTALHVDDGRLGRLDGGQSRDGEAEQRAGHADPP